MDAWAPFFAALTPSLAAVLVAALTVGVWEVARGHFRRGAQRLNIAVAIFTELQIARGLTEFVLNREEVDAVIARMESDAAYRPFILQSKSNTPAFDALTSEIGVLTPAAASAVYRAYDGINSMENAFSFINSRRFGDLVLDRRTHALTHIARFVQDTQMDIQEAERELAIFILPRVRRLSGRAVVLGASTSERQFISALRTAVRQSG